MQQFAGASQPSPRAESSGPQSGIRRVSATFADDNTLGLSTAAAPAARLGLVVRFVSRESWQLPTTSPACVPSARDAKRKFSHRGSRAGRPVVPALFDLCRMINELGVS
jgi:hypothetical protein